MPTANAPEESNVYILSLHLSPYISPIIPHTGIPMGKAKNPVVRKQTSMMIPIAVNTLFFKLFI